jgi:hypothetical protein
MKRFVFAFALLLTTSAAFADGGGLPPLPPHAAAVSLSSGASLWSTVWT